MHTDKSSRGTAIGYVPDIQRSRDFGDVSKRYSQVHTLNKQSELVIAYSSDARTVFANVSSRTGGSYARLDPTIY